MSDSALRTVLLICAALVVVASGVLLMRSGWPFGTLVLTLHKLVALAGVVVIGVLVARTWRTAPPATEDVIIAGAALALAIASFASGGVVAASKSAPAWVLWLHRAGTFAAVGTAAWCYARLG